MTAGERCGRCEGWRRGQQGGILGELFAAEAWRNEVLKEEEDAMRQSMEQEIVQGSSLLPTVTTHRTAGLNADTWLFLTRCAPC